MSRLHTPDDPTARGTGVILPSFPPKRKLAQDGLSGPCLYLTIPLYTHLLIQKKRAQTVGREPYAPFSFGWIQIPPSQGKLAWDKTTCPGREKVILPSHYWLLSGIRPGLLAMFGPRSRNVTETKSKIIGPDGMVWPWCKKGKKGPTKGVLSRGRAMSNLGLCHWGDSLGKRPINVWDIILKKILAQQILKTFCE